MGFYQVLRANCTEYPRELKFTDKKRRENSGKIKKHIARIKKHKFTQLEVLD